MVATRSTRKVQESSSNGVSKGGSNITMKLLLLTVFLPVSFVMFPNFWWHGIVLVDYFTEWSSFKSEFVNKYHKFLTDRLPDLEEQPAIEIHHSEATIERITELSNGFTVPIVIRGAVAGARALTEWTDVDFWTNSYANESVMCKFVGGYSDSNLCTIKDAFGLGEDSTQRQYISGESKMFKRRPELETMVNSPFLDALDATGAMGTKVFTQIFMGFAKDGSDIHAAIGCNIFRQIAGRKKWWLIPTTQTAFVYSSLNQNGFSAHTKTNVGKQDEEESPWMKKLERYTVELDPGDVLINTSWYWHGILNLGEDPDALIIGVPTRYKLPSSSAALRSNWLFSIIARFAIEKQFGIANFVKDTGLLQDGITKARSERAAKV